MISQLGVCLLYLEAIMAKAYLIDELSVFFPTYNEEANIATTVSKAVAVLEKVAKNWEITVVNDGSRDRTEEIALSLAKKEKRIKVITHSPNRGYGGAMQSGVYAAHYPWIAFTDSDGQFDFSEITKFIAKQKETNADLVIGYYKKRQVSFSKILTSKMWELVVFILFGLHVRDIDCGFKLLSKKVIDSIPKLESERGAFIKGFKIVEIPVTHYPRTAGSGTGRNLDVIIKSFVDLFKLWKKLR
jgi:glycosyltransferase involved in cell wall biosynthesis